jgi:glycerate-2-kinase
MLDDQVGPPGTASVGRVLATLARESPSTGSPWPRGTVVVACGGECTWARTRTRGSGGLVDWSTAGWAREHGLSLRKGLVDHATTALLAACGDAVLTGATLTNANDLVIVGVR